MSEVRRLQDENTALRAEVERAWERVREVTRDLDAWGHDRDCARLQARGRPNDDSVKCDCNLESYGFGR